MKDMLYIYSVGPSGDVNYRSMKVCRLSIIKNESMGCPVLKTAWT